MNKLALALCLAATKVAGFADYSKTPSIGDRLEVNFKGAVEVGLNYDPEAWEKIAEVCPSGGGGPSGIYKVKDWAVGFQAQGNPFFIVSQTGRTYGMVWGFDETFPASPASNLKPDDPSNPAMHSDLCFNDDCLEISITVYFNDPAKLCDESYSVPEGSVGDRVWYQLTDDDFLEVPLDEDVDALSGLGFYAGGCTSPGQFLAQGIPGGLGLQYWGLEGDDCIGMSPITLMYDKGELASIGIIVYGDGDHVTLPEGQEAGGCGPGAAACIYPKSMWDSPPGYFLPPFMGALMSDCVLATNAILYGVADPGEIPNRKASVMHVALKSTLDRQCE